MGGGFLCAEASGVSCGRAVCVPGRLSAYVCQCVTERVSRASPARQLAGVSVFPSVPEMQCNGGEELASGSLGAGLLLLALPPSLCKALNGHFPALGLSFLKCKGDCMVHVGGQPSRLGDCLSGTDSGNSSASA